MLLTGEEIHEVRIETPGGITYRPEIEEITRVKKEMGNQGNPDDTEKVLFSTVSDTVSCAVRKDGGDDPDVTTGLLIFASVRLVDLFVPEEKGTRIRQESVNCEHRIPILIDGGVGIGRVTKPGLDQPVGAAAINHVPREMIERSVREILEEFPEGLRRAGQFCSGRDQSADSVHSVPEPSGRNSVRLNLAVHVLISILGGEERAARTFNPKLGIVGGLSVLGTTGIVEPMSDRALVETIRTEIRMHRAQGEETLAFAPGNYGLTFLEKEYGLPRSASVTISNFAADAVEMAADAGCRKLLLTGHIGKLVKIAGGIRNTHSRYGDHRMEILSALAQKYCPQEDFPNLREKLMRCAVTGEAVRILREAGIAQKVLADMARAITGNLENWSGGRIRAEVIVFMGQKEELVRTEGALQFMREIREYEESNISDL